MADEAKAAAAIDADASGDAPMLASLMASGGGRISTAVALEDDPEPVVGSFTADGLTYVVGDREAALVSIGSRATAFAADLAGTDEGPLAGFDDAPSGENSGSEVPTLPSPSLDEAPSDGLEGKDASEPVILGVPESVECDGTTYAVVAIGPRAFAGGDADVVVLPASVETVDELAFRGSAVAAVEVAPGNPRLSSYDGMLFDADQTSLLLIPEGKQGAARIPKTASTVPPSAFSHCAGVTSIEVDEGSAAYLSRNACLYDVTGTTLLRVPAGAEEADIADGCTAVAPGALEGCARLRSVQAPASVVEVAPDVLGIAGDGHDASVVPIGPSGQLAAADGDRAADMGDADAVKEGPAEGAQASSGDAVDEAVVEARAPAESGEADSARLTSPVALAAAGGDLPKVNPAAITVSVPEGADLAPWEAIGFTVEVAPLDAADGADPVEGEPLDGLAPEDAHDRNADEPGSAPSDDQAIAGEVTVGYGYANERSMGSYERALPKVDAVLRLQPVTAEDLVEGRAAANGTAGSPTLASKLADLPEESQATASFLYQGCLYVIDPEGGAALVAVDPKRLAEYVEDPTTLILPDYVDDGTWSYPLTRIAKGALRGSGIERLWIPASTTYLDYALEGCETLRYVEISEDSPVYSSKDGCLYDKSGETLWMMPEGAMPHLEQNREEVAGARKGLEAVEAPFGSEGLARQSDLHDVDAGTLGKASVFDCMSDKLLLDRASQRVSTPDFLSPIRQARISGVPIYVPEGHEVSWLTSMHMTASLQEPHDVTSWELQDCLFPVLVNRQGIFLWNSLSNKWSAAYFARVYPCVFKCRAAKVSTSPDGPQIEGADFEQGEGPIYVTGRASADGTHPVTFYLDDSDTPETYTINVSSLNGAGALGLARPLGRVCEWTTLPDGETYTPFCLFSDKESAISEVWATLKRSAYRATVFHDSSQSRVVEELTAVPGKYLPRLSAVPARLGYSFAGVADDKDLGHGTQYINEANRAVSIWTLESDTALYCQWAPMDYSVSICLDGGQIDGDIRGSYTIEDAFDLPTPTRYGYQFDGWDVAGVGEDGSLGPVLGAGVEDVTAEDGSKVTRVKAGTYGDLSCTARWTLRYDLDVPVADPGEVTFEADSLTGQVRVRPGTSAEGAILSYMAVPVALDTLACEGLDASGQPDAAGGAPELEAIFGAGSASQVLFTATVGEGNAPRVAKLTAGGAGSTASLAGLSVPAATSHDAPGRISISYGLELDSSLAIPPVRDAMPVARLAYTVTLPNESLQIERAEHMN